MSAEHTPYAMNTSLVKQLQMKLPINGCVAVPLSWLVPCRTRQSGDTDAGTHEAGGAVLREEAGHPPVSTSAALAQ